MQGYKIEIRNDKLHLLDSWVSHAPNAQAAKEEASNKRNRCFSQCSYQITDKKTGKRV